MDFPKLPKLSHLAKSHRGLDFGNVSLLAIQHLMATNGSLLELLDTAGLPYSRMFLLGKVYSTNEAVYRELKNRGVHVSSASTTLQSVNLKVDYKDYLRDAAYKLLKESAGTLSAKDTLLVVDDGGVLISVVSEHLDLIPCRVVCVEQTRSGVETIRDLNNVVVPIVNVAESKTKLVDESPYIATSIIEKLITRITAIPAIPKLSQSTVLVVGMGAIGTEVANQLQPMVKDLHAYDIKDSKQNLDSLKAAITDSNIVIGCVGKRWLPNDKSCIVNGTIFVSGSSSNTEFLGLDINNAVSESSTLTFTSKDMVLAHADYQVEKYSWVLNGGFPVNFDGSQDPIEPKTVELTRLLMLAGMLQAISNKVLPNGLMPLDGNLQSEIKSLGIIETA